MKSAVAVVIAAALTVLGAAAPALARRAATPAEQAALRAISDPRFTPCGPAAVSTVDPAWASVGTVNGDGVCSDVFAVLTRDAVGGWNAVAFVQGELACIDVAPEVPEAVAADLTGCARTTRRRIATAQERTAVLAALPAGGAPQACWTVRVSRRDERFATATSSLSAFVDGCPTRRLLLSRASGAWTVLAADRDDTFSCAQPGVPADVVRSLVSDCHVPRVALMCFAAGGTVAPSRPRGCLVRSGRRRLVLGGVAWSGWGGAHAHGRGVAWGVRGAGTGSVPVRLDAFAPVARWCATASSVYTRLRISHGPVTRVVDGRRVTLPAATEVVRLPPREC